MDEYLRAEREANRKAAALHYVGPEVGVGATIWARAVQDVLALHESARARFAANTAGLEDWERSTARRSCSSSPLNRSSVSSRPFDA